MDHNAAEKPEEQEHMSYLHIALGIGGIRKQPDVPRTDYFTALSRQA
jgi:hypothetical protein